MSDIPPEVETVNRKAEYQRAWRLDRKLTPGACTRCPKKGLPEGEAMCQRCRRKYRKIGREYQRNLHRERRAGGWCAACGKVKSTTYRCAGCVVKQGRVPPSIAARKPETKPGGSGDAWRKDNDGWERYRGRGRRGAPGAAVNDDQDLASAADVLDKGRKALRYARSPEVMALPRIQRKGALREATALIALAARFLDDLVDRNSDDGDR